MRLLFSLFFLAGCASHTSWKYDTLAKESDSIGSARLLYSDPKSSSSIRFEMTRIGYQTTAYLNLIQHRLSQDSKVAVSLYYENEIYEEEVPVLEGKMRLRLSQEMTERLIQALREGKQVKITADGFQETLQSESFNPLYQRLVKNGSFLQNILKGPLEWINLNN